MLKHASTALKYIPLIIALAVLIGGAFFVPWHDVLPYFTKLGLVDYATLLILAAAFYLVRIGRYGYILRSLGEKNLSYREVAQAYMIGQPISLIPGGEFYRSVLLKRHANVSMKNGVPTVFMQSLTEGAGLVVLALIGALALKRYVLLVTIVAVVYGVIMALIYLHNTGRHAHKLINHVPFVSISLAKLRTFMNKNQKALSGKNFLVLMLTSVASTLILVVALLELTHTLGISLNFMQAMIAISVPMIIQYASFLPGGIGANEQGSVGILVLLHVSFGAAVALTLLLRVISLWFGVLLGLIVLLATKEYRDKLPLLRRI
ncbi:MAG TPA: lysylphosphatidylglycerol synthase transmembrane domain-containing protein [Patescibacteria group bacterium]|jgi:uncharacterized protein (TIRG00374 family)|nr:lysylphosphatidylglycerol synthase transmembrane domain-containing protein [Patescibacteria group bacterium]